MRRTILILAGLLLLPIPLPAQTADDIIARYVKTVGGMSKIAAVTTLRRTGKYVGNTGFEARVTQENKRPQKVREDFLVQGMDGVTAWDGKTGWKIEPWDGKKDPTPLGEEEMTGILEDADFDGPLVNYRQKGNKVELVGSEPVEGTDTFKLKVTLAIGETQYYYMDKDYFVPIKIDTKRMVRGAEREYEMTLGDYNEVAGWYLPFSYEINTKGSQSKQKTTFERIEANVPVPDQRFDKAAAAPKPTQQPDVQPPDASQKQPATQPQPPAPTKEEKKPPMTKAVAGYRLPVTGGISRTSALATGYRQLATPR
jgi:hypothetical protein